ncbi:MAG: four helix bundle protein [Fimbriiglobus sp.]
MAQPLQSYRDLSVWQKAMDLVEMSYNITKRFPKEELFGLTNQLRRAAVSIPANIAEGYGRSHRPDYLRFLAIARGSLFELETHLILCGRLEYASREDLTPIWQTCQEVGKMLRRLIEVLKNSNP